MSIILFILGTILGSFINVLTRRYDDTDSFFSLARIRGRSHCESCQRELRWYELIPIVSFIIQGGRCRSCHARVSIQYPIVEIISGLIVAGFPAFFRQYYMIPQLEILGEPASWFAWLITVWVLSALALLALSIVDLRLKIIPDGLTILLVLLGIAGIVVQSTFQRFGAVEGSFFETYAPIFGVRQNIFINHLFGAVVGLVVFGVIFLVTRGKGIGLGDVKLAGALGFLFGWPDAILIFVFASIIGFIAGVFLMLFRGMTMKDAIPFGPFLALGAYLVWFCGKNFVGFYFGLFV